MELILKQDVENLGFKDDVVTVKNGYGRNYLIPQGYAILATSSAKKVLAENLTSATTYFCQMIYMYKYERQYSVTWFTSSVEATNKIISEISQKTKFKLAKRGRGR